MKIILTAEDRIQLVAEAGPLTVEAASADMQYSPFHMVASGLALCTFSVLYSWAEHADIPADGLALEVSWRFGERPHRVEHYTMRVRWPGLPEGRRTAAQRAAALCPIHATLQHPPGIVTEIEA